MAGRKTKDKTRVDVDYIVSWALYHSKIPVKKIAQEREQTPASIYWQIKQVDRALEEKLDMDKLKDLALLCYPAALDSLIYNLQVKRDASVTNNYLNKTIFADVKDSEANINTNIFSLGAGLNQQLRQLDIDSLRGLIDELQRRIAKKRESSLVSRIKGSSDN